MPKMSYPYANVIVVRKDKQMDSRYKKIDFLNLQEVEQELDLMLEIVGDRDIDPKTEKYILDLIGIAKALGTRKAY